MLLKTDGAAKCVVRKYENNFRKSILIAEIHSTIY